MQQSDRPMNTTEKILEEVRTLSEAQAREVLDFAAFLKTRRISRGAPSPDMDAFNRFGAVYEGGFRRDECYDRDVLR